MTECNKTSPQSHEALLSSADGFTAFSFGGYNIRFRAPYSLERYVDLYFTSFCVVECMHVHASDSKLTEGGSAKFFVKNNGDFASEMHRCDEETGDYRS